jgi:hypothetical protein
VRRADAARVPGPAALLAFTAWQCGEGALANIAIDRALAADPGYSMALLLRDVIDAGVPPSAARVPMSPEEVEESYAQDSGTGPRHRGLEGREGLGERGRRGGHGGGGGGGGGGAGGGGGGGGGPGGARGMKRVTRHKADESLTLDFPSRSSRSA